MARRQVAVIGLGRFGSSVARTLYQIGHDVLAIDNDDRLVQELTGSVSYAVNADATSEAVLRELGVPNFDIAIVAIGADIQSSIMTTVLLKSLGLRYIVARAKNALHGQALERVGANHVVYPEQETGVRLARSLFNPDVLEYMDLNANFGISKVKIPDTLRGLTLKEAGLAGARAKSGISVLAVQRGKDTILLPSEDERLRPGDLLVIATKDELLEKLHSV